MKITDVLLALALLLLSSLWSCELFGDEPTPKPATELDKLPPLTQTGENNFGCLVNGKAWVPVGCLRSASGANLFWPNFFTVNAQWTCVDESMGLSIATPEGTSINKGTYPIVSSLERGESDYAGAAKFTTIGYCFFELWHTLSGSITITKLDKTEKIASGTFEFTTANEACDTIRVTDGRFDFRYID